MRLIAGFEHNNPDFLISLSEAYPELSPTERRICVLIRLQCATKEIAAILNRSVRTIQTHKHNIRKKMGLDSRHDLVSAILNISHTANKLHKDIL